MNPDLIPSLSSFHDIAPSQAESFRKEGHVLVTGLLSDDEIQLYRQSINETAYRYNTEKRQLQDRDTYGKAFLQIMNLWEHSTEVKKFTLAKRFAGVAAQLLGVENVRLYHDQALYKEAGGGPTPWHQDQYYWPLSTTKTITMWMPLIDITEEMGMLSFASGSHLGGFNSKLAISDQSDRLFETLIRDKGFMISRPSSMRAGDTSWHYGWTMHNAPANDSSMTREVMTIIYFADGARVTEPENEHQEADRQRWLGGLPPGELAAGALNPLLL